MLGNSLYHPPDAAKRLAFLRCQTNRHPSILEHFGSRHNKVPILEECLTRFRKNATFAAHPFDSELTQVGTMELQEEFHETGFLRWRRTFPWLHLLRVPGIAARMPILFVGFLTSLLLLMLDAALGNPLFPHEIPRLFMSEGRWMIAFFESILPSVTGYGLWRTISMGDYQLLFTSVLPRLVLHIISGLILCRLAGSAFTTGSCTGLKSSISSGFRNLPAAALSLILPVLLLSLLGLVSWGIAALSGIPGLGSWLYAAFYGPGLAITFVMLVFAIGVLIGWPLLMPAIAIEGGDGFDAWSRCFDYVRSRLISLLVMFAPTILLGLAIYAILGDLTLLTWNWLDGLAHNSGADLSRIVANFNGTYRIAAQLPEDPFSTWKILWYCGIAGFLKAYFWVTIASIYVLTRYSVDRVPMSEFRE